MCSDGYRLGGYNVPKTANARGITGDAEHRHRQSDVRYNAKTAYDIAAPFYDGWSWQAFWHSNEWPIIHDILASETAPRLVLDVGTGTGAYLERVGHVYAHARLFGMDVSTGMLSRARTRLGGAAYLVSGDARAIPFTSGAFDLVLMTRVASNIQNLFTVVQEIGRVLRPGAIAIASDISPVHDYTCTELPTDHGKIGVETYKHRMPDWRAASKHAQLQFGQLVEINATNSRVSESYPRSNDRLGERSVGFVVVLRKMGEHVPS